MKRRNKLDLPDEDDHTSANIQSSSSLMDSKKSQSVNLMSRLGRSLLTIGVLLVICFILTTMMATRNPCRSHGCDGPDGEQKGLRFISNSNQQSKSLRESYHKQFAFIGNLWYGIENIWEDLLIEGAGIYQESKYRPVAMEVGMHRPKQCLMAAKLNFEVHCMEPSPKSFRICSKGVESNEDIKSLIHLHNIAAGDTDGTVEFNAGGSTGDHVGNVNVWEMKKTVTKEEDNKGTVQVRSARLDTIISENVSPTADIWMVKIDTQGFEPSVFAGLSETIKQKRIKVILFEFWPKGMDLMLGDGDERCKVSVKILNDLVSAGYSLFQTYVAHHPRAQVARDEIKSITRETRPMDDFEKNCNWYYTLEDTRFLREDYHMGYWTDIVALAPDFQLMKPKTTTGDSLQEMLPESKFLL